METGKQSLQAKPLGETTGRAILAPLIQLLKTGDLPATVKAA
jgi:hypothetical protein